MNDDQQGTVARQLTVVCDIGGRREPTKQTKNNETNENFSFFRMFRLFSYVS
jgi:hypothetical protein